MYHLPFANSFTYGVKREKDGTWTMMMWQYGNRVKLFKSRTCRQARSFARKHELTLHGINRDIIRKNDDELHGKKET